jgi:hypothetical protein
LNFEFIITATFPPAGSVIARMREDLAYTDAWHLEGYRRTTTGPDVYVVLTSDGTLIDLHGYLKGMLARVSLPFGVEYDRPFRFTSDVAETWNLYVHPLNDGIVILGARTEISPPNVNERFVASAARFGRNVADAANVPERAIDEAFDVAIIDARGMLRWAIGGIPLKTAAPNIPDRPLFVPLLRADGDLFAPFIEPVTSRSGQKVGFIRVFDDVTDEQDVLYRSALFNVVVAAILWVVTVATAAVFLKRPRVADISCSQIPFLKENDTVEFKSSLRWSYRENRSDPEVERAVIKTVAGLLNSYRGGNLVIGLSDEGDCSGFSLTIPL